MYLVPFHYNKKTVTKKFIFVFYYFAEGDRLKARINSSFAGISMATGTTVVAVSVVTTGGGAEAQALADLRQKTTE